MVKTAVNPILFLFAMTLAVAAGPSHLVDEAPVQISRTESGIIVVDFGRVAFGNICLMPPAGADRDMTVHFGEAVVDREIKGKEAFEVRRK